MSAQESPRIERRAVTAAWIVGFLWLAILLANVPARAALGQHLAQFGIHGPAYALTGLAVDTVDFLLLFTVVNLLVALIARVALRRRLPTYPAALRATIVPTTTGMFLIDLLGSVWAAEHQIERGLYPTLFELNHAVDAGFALAGARVFLLSRFSYTTLLVLVLLAIATVVVRRRLLRAHNLAALPLAASVLGLSIAVSLACFGWHRASPLIIASFPNWRTIESPLQVFLSFGMDRENVRLGSLSLFQGLDLPASHLDPGAALLGLPTSTVQRLPEIREQGACNPHPLASPVAPFQAPSDPSAAYHHELHRALDDLSRALFERREGPTRIWLLSLESLRADDIHALHARAPREVAPYSTGLYEQARKGAGNVIVAERMLQAGGRTAQGLAAMTCGLGTMPYGLSAARDLGLLPLRCLPDVLKDASFRTAFYYGSNPGFDNMLAFLNHHGFDRIKAEKDYVEEVPHAGWSVPDGIVFAQAFEEAEKEPAGQSQFNFAMSLTNHFPFKRPEDFPELIGQRVAKAVEGRSVRPDDVSRLETLSYTDWAFEQFVGTLSRSESARHSLVVATADHSTTDYFLWREGDDAQDKTLALVHVPFMIVLPDAFLAASPDPALARQQARRVNELLATSPLSHNDIPRMVLSILMHSAPLRALEHPWRWHNLGGQRLSPSFRVPSRADAVVMGVDGTSRLYFATAAGSLTQSEEKAVPTLDRETALQSGPTMLPSAAVFSALLRGYGSTCWPASAIRNRP